MFKSDIIFSIGPCPYARNGWAVFTTTESCWRMFQCLEDWYFSPFYDMLKEIEKKYKISLQAVTDGTFEVVTLYYSEVDEPKEPEEKIFTKEEVIKALKEYGWRKFPAFDEFVQKICKLEFPEYEIK